MDPTRGAAIYGSLAVSTCACVVLSMGCFCFCHRASGLPALINRCASPIRTAGDVLELQDRTTHDGVRTAVVAAIGYRRLLGDHEGSRLLSDALSTTSVSVISRSRSLAGSYQPGSPSTIAPPHQVIDMRGPGDASRDQSRTSNAPIEEQHSMSMRRNGNRNPSASSIVFSQFSSGETPSGHRAESRGTIDSPRVPSEPESIDQEGSLASEEAQNDLQELGDIDILLLMRQKRNEMRFLEAEAERRREAKESSPSTPTSRRSEPPRPHRTLRERFSVSPGEVPPLPSSWQSSEYLSVMSDVSAPPSSGSGSDKPGPENGHGSEARQSPAPRSKRLVALASPFESLRTNSPRTPEQSQPILRDQSQPTPPHSTHLPRLRTKPGCNPKASPLSSLSSLRASSSPLPAGSTPNTHSLRQRQKRNIERAKNPIDLRCSKSVSPTKGLSAAAISSKTGLASHPTPTGSGSSDSTNNDFARLEKKYGPRGPSKLLDGVDDVVESVVEAGKKGKAGKSKKS